MPDEQQNRTKPREWRPKVTAEISLAARDAIDEIQRQHRRKTGKYKYQWEIIDAAVRAYAKRQGIEVGE